MNKLTHVESSRIVSVLDEALEKISMVRAGVCMHPRWCCSHRCLGDGDPIRVQLSYLPISAAASYTFSGVDMDPATKRVLKEQVRLPVFVL